MKQFFGKKSRSALAMVLIVSLALHVVAILIFGTIKFVSEALREETVFEAAPVEPPPQQEPEYKVNIQQRNQSAPPPRPPAIVVNNPSELDIPTLDIDVNVDTSAVYGRGGGGFGGGLKQVRQMALNLTEFGYTGDVPGTLKGSLFDTKRDTDGKVLVDVNEFKGYRALRNALNNRAHEIVSEFINGSTNIQFLDRKYFRADQNLYSSYWVIQSGDAKKAPSDFGAADQIEPMGILAFYEGSFRPQESGTFRFIGRGDDVLIVKIGSQIVLDASVSDSYSKWEQKEHETGEPFMGMARPMVYGDWIDWRTGDSLYMKVLLGETPGGEFGCYLLYQKKGEEKLRVFTTKPLTSNEKNRLRSVHPDIAKLL